MLYSYSLSHVQARTCRFVAALFLVASLAQAGALMVSLLAPHIAASAHCGSDGCRSTVRSEMQLPEDISRQISRMPDGRTRLQNRIGAPAPRLGLAAADIAAQLPPALLFLCVAIAIRRLAQDRQDALARAIAWLRWASIAALIAVVAAPLATGLRDSILLSVADGGVIVSFEADVRQLLMNLLLAGAAFIVTWALAAGSRAQRDIAEIV